MVAFKECDDFRKAEPLHVHHSRDECPHIHPFDDRPTPAPRLQASADTAIESPNFVQGLGQPPSNRAGSCTVAG